jgi:hypothetical protein
MDEKYLDCGGGDAFKASQNEDYDVMESTGVLEQVILFPLLGIKSFPRTQASPIMSKESL